MPTLRSSGDAASEAAAPNRRVRLERGRGGELGDRDRCADPDAVAVRLDAAEPRVAKIDESRRLADSAVDLPREVGAAADRRGAVLAEKLERLVERGRTRVAAHASASSTRAGVSGTAAARRPVACANAFAIAAAVGTIGGSPSPFAPRLGRFSSGTVDEVDDDLGRVGDGRHLVVVEVPVDGCAGRRVDV